MTAWVSLIIETEVVTSPAAAASGSVTMLLTCRSTGLKVVTIGGGELSPIAELEGVMSYTSILNFAETCGTVSSRNTTPAVDFRDDVFQSHGVPQLGKRRYGNRRLDRDCSKR